MSVFLVRYGVIDDVIETARACAARPFDPDACGRRLLRLNVAALLHRYPEIATARGGNGRAEYETSLAYASRYRFQRGHPDPAQRAKSCACLRYQCGEGDVPGHALYQALDRLTEAAVARDPWGDSEIWDRARSSGADAARLDGAA